MQSSSELPAAREMSLAPTEGQERLIAIARALGCTRRRQRASRIRL